VVLAKEEEGLSALLYGERVWLSRTQREDMSIRKFEEAIHDVRSSHEENDRSLIYFFGRGGRKFSKSIPT